MMHQNTVLAVVGTRPEAIKMAPVLHALAARDVRVRLVSTGQHRELLAPALRFFDLRPDIELEVMRPEQPLNELTARILDALDPVLRDERPALVLAQGDTTTVLATALACMNRSVPLGHVEAGLRSGDVQQPFPEEMNRILVDRMAHLHFAPTHVAADNLRREGISDIHLHVTGNPIVDALQHARARAPVSAHTRTDGSKLILVTAHRRESFGAGLRSICRAVLDLANREDVHVLFPLHRNPNARDVARQLLANHDRITLTEPLDYAEMVGAMIASHLILTDSGGIQEEAPCLDKPVLVLRNTTERAEGVASGAARLVGTAHDAIVRACSELLDDDEAHSAMARADNPYGDGHAGRRIAELCVNFVND